MSKIFKSNFLSADKAAEFLSIFEPTVAQIQTISSKLTREAEGIVIKTELEKMPEGWISGKYFSASLASQESQESSSSKPSWNSPKKFKDFGLNPVTADRKEWRHKADIFRKMVNCRFLMAGQSKRKAVFPQNQN